MFGDETHHHQTSNFPSNDKFYDFFQSCYEKWIEWKNKWENNNSLFYSFQKVLVKVNLDMKHNNRLSPLKSLKQKKLGSPKKHK